MKKLEKLEAKLEKLEALAEKKRCSIKEKQQALKKDTDSLKSIELEIRMIKGEAYSKDINRLNLSNEEYQNLRKYVLRDKTSVLDVIHLLEDESVRKQEGDGVINET